MELMIASAVLLIALVGLLATYAGCYRLNETARNLTIAVNLGQEQLEGIRNHGFASIVTDYSAGGTPGDTFTPAPLDGSGIITIINNGDDDAHVTNVDLIEVTITICWRQRGNLIVGEDADLDGNWVLASEDANGNGRFDSPAQIVTLIARR